MTRATRVRLLRSHERTCVGKFPYSSKARAKRSLTRRDAKKALNVYLCDACGNWHVGHKPRKPSRQEVW